MTCPECDTAYADADTGETEALTERGACIACLFEFDIGTRERKERIEWTDKKQPLHQLSMSI